MEKFLKILKQFWGYDQFRSIQGDIIRSISDGRDTLGLMPTGGGKSITFQVPALSTDGLCLVVTPLIALMTDQVERLKRMDIKAEAIHSGLSPHEIRIILDNAVYGAVKFLYVSPERLGSDAFKEKLRHMPVAMIVVDEAHCISQWGYDFRPSYLQIASARKIVPDAPILALTATATPEVAEDIQSKLNFKEKNLIQTDFSRNNLVYFVRRSDSKLDDMVRVANSIRGTGVVYVRNRRKTKELAELLNQKGCSTDYYHAGLSSEVRNRKQNHWTQGKIRIMVSTNAFGMGIDKPDVRFVIHMDLPDSPEEYFQEAGRAGRDGKKAFAVLLVGKRDKQIASSRLSSSFPEIDYVKRTYQAVCNFLQVPLGGGKGIAFDFNLHNFTVAFKLQPIMAYSALKLLEQQGYIEVTDELNNASRVHFITSRDDLYRFQVANYQFDGFIKLLLRSYTGLFTDYVSINEEDLARRANLSRDTVYQYLLKLAKAKIINYIPAKKTPLVVFLEERLDDKSVFISKENYSDRKERFKKRLNAMIDYAFNESDCRSKYLLSYFGQTDGEECGQCDVCKSKKQASLIDEEYAQLIEQLKKKLEKKACSPKQLVEELGFPELEIKTVIGQLLDKEIIYYNDSDLLEIKDTL